MSHVRIEDVSVRIPVFEANALRLLRMPSFGRAKVGASNVSHAGALFVIHALSNIDLVLEEGDRVCIVGHNGAGKTTLLRLVAGIYPPSSGRVEVKGKIMALLGQNLAPNPDATGYENIKLIANLYDWPKERLPEYIRDIEEFTELGEYLSLPARIYSAGMHALVHRLVVLSKPLAGDVARARAVAMTQFVTHQMAERARLIDDGEPRRLDEETFLANLVHMAVAMLSAPAPTSPSRPTRRRHPRDR